MEEISEEHVEVEGSAVQRAVPEVALDRTLSGEARLVRTLRRWIVGIATYVGIINTVGGSRQIPDVVKYFRNVTADRAEFSPGAFWIIGSMLVYLVGSVAMLWGAWWCFQQRALGPRIVRWATLAITAYVVQFIVLDAFGAVRSGPPEGSSNFGNIIYAVTSRVRVGLLPAMLAGLTWSAAMSRIIAPQGDEERSESFPESERASSDAGGTPAGDVSSEDVRAAVQRGVRVIAWAAILLGGPGLLLTAHSIFVLQGRLSWSRPGAFGEYWWVSLSQLVTDASYVLLTAGGAALLMRWRYRRRLALAGAISELLMVATYSLTWSRSVSGTVVFLFLELPQIFCSIFMIRFLMLGLVREELRDAEREPQSEGAPPPAEAEKDAP